MSIDDLSANGFEFYQKGFLGNYDHSQFYDFINIIPTSSSVIKSVVTL